MNTEQLQIIERLTKQGMNSPEYLLTNIIKESYLTKSIFEMKIQMEDADKKEKQKQRMLLLKSDFYKLKRTQDRLDLLSHLAYLEWESYLDGDQEYKYISKNFDDAFELLITYIQQIMQYIKKHNIETKYDEDKYEDGYPEETYELINEILPSIYIGEDVCYFDNHQTQIDFDLLDELIG